jgi:two-component system, LytTR family, response regulator
MNTLSVPCHPKNTLINTDEIVRLEGSGNYTILHMIDGRHFLTSKSLIYFEERLPFPFIRIHKSCLINICHVLQRKTADSVSMADGAEVPVARRRRPELKKYLKCPRKSRLRSV